MRLSPYRIFVAVFSLFVFASCDLHKESLPNVEKGSLMVVAGEQLKPVKLIAGEWFGPRHTGVTKAQLGIDGAVHDNLVWIENEDMYRVLSKTFPSTNFNGEYPILLGLLTSASPDGKNHTIPASKIKGLSLTTFVLGSSSRYRHYYFERDGNGAYDLIPRYNVSLNALPDCSSYIDLLLGAVGGSMAPRKAALYLVRPETIPKPYLDSKRPVDTRLRSLVVNDPERAAKSRCGEGLCPKGSTNFTTVGDSTSPNYLPTQCENFSSCPNTHYPCCYPAEYECGTCEEYGWGASVAGASAGSELEYYINDQEKILYNFRDYLIEANPRAKRFANLAYKHFDKFKINSTNISTYVDFFALFNSKMKALIGETDSLSAEAKFIDEQLYQSAMQIVEIHRDVPDQELQKDMDLLVDQLRRYKGLSIAETRSKLQQTH